MIPKRIVVSRCMAATAILQFIESTIDKFYYFNILKNNMDQSDRNLGFGNDYYFQGEAEIVKLWFLNSVPQQAYAFYNSDLNYIEHLWN